MKDYLDVELEKQYLLLLKEFPNSQLPSENIFGIIFVRGAKYATERLSK